MQTGDSADQSGEQDLDDEPLYVISVAAKLAGLPLWTLRVLDREGIVRPQRTATDRRLYSDRDIARLARVRYLTEQRGVNMNGVRLILEMEAQRESKSGPGDAQSTHSAHAQPDKASDEQVLDEETY